MLVLCHKTCSTCAKALKFLDNNQIQYEKRDIKANSPSYNELKSWFQQSNLPIKRFFNTSGMAYRALDLKDKLPQMSEDDCLKLLATDGMLVKRPLVVGDDFILLGFKEKEWEMAML